MALKVSGKLGVMGNGELVEEYQKIRQIMSDEGTHRSSCHCYTCYYYRRISYEIVRRFVMEHAIVYPAKENELPKPQHLVSNSK